LTHSFIKQMCQVAIAQVLIYTGYSSNFMSTVQFKINSYLLPE